MIGMFNTITIDGDEIFRGNSFTLQREYIYGAEITTCTGKVCADLIGWHYADLTLEWGNLPQVQLQKILALTGEAVEVTFSNEENETVTEEVIPSIIAASAQRFTDPYGDAAWTGIKLQLRFINAHHEE